MKNQVQLITYADRLTGGGLSQLDAMLRGRYWTVRWGAYFTILLSYRWQWCEVRSYRSWSGR